MKTAHDERPMMMGSVRRRVLFCAVGLLWSGAIVAGFGWLGNYDNRPGEAAHAPAVWPAESHIARDPEGLTLVMLAHPLCTCTRASLAELAELLGRATAPPRTYVLFIRPEQADNDWAQTELRRIAASIPHVTVIEDRDGVEASRFGAATSGQVVLYDAGGALRYSGGTTGARGHVGENAGRAAILAVVNHEAPDRATAKVFGCPLF